MRHTRDDQGSVGLLFAISLLVIMAMLALSLDLGRAYVARSAAKAAADAAALAGASALPQDPTAAIALATQTLSANHAAGTVTLLNTTELQVSLKNSINFLFGPLIGVPSASYTVTSVAQVGSITAATGAVPLGIVDQSLTFGQLVTLKSSRPEDGSFGPGQFGALWFGDGDLGAEIYGQDLAQGYAGTLQVGQQIYTEPGNRVGPTDAALLQRIWADPQATAGNLSPVSPRLLIIPVVTPTTGGGSQATTIVGFAAFFLTSVSGGEVTGEFLQMVHSGEEGSLAHNNYGLLAVHLVQ